MAIPAVGTALETGAVRARLLTGLDGTELNSLFVHRPVYQVTITQGTATGTRSIYIVLLTEMNNRCAASPSKSSNGETRGKAIMCSSLVETMPTFAG